MLPTLSLTFKLSLSFYIHFKLFEWQQQETSEYQTGQIFEKTESVQLLNDQFEKHTNSPVFTRTRPV
jgi:hypothetical protein